MFLNPGGGVGSDDCPKVGVLSCRMVGVGVGIAVGRGDIVTAIDFVVSVGLEVDVGITVSVCLGWL